MAGTTPETLPVPDVVAAGCVVLHEGCVLLVHRPKYDDWSFPKGKQDPGEREVVTAVRETLEETGVEVRIGRPLISQAYVQLDGRTKLVHYWMGVVVGDPDVAAYAANAEIDAVAWVPVAEARHRLSYPRDGLVLADALADLRPTSTLIVVRHAKASSRKQWREDDRLRPLSEEGSDQARALAPVLAAYGISQIVTSTSTRCVETLTPYSQEYLIALRATPVLAEEHPRADDALDLLRGLLSGRVQTVLCSHRPVLPTLLERLGVEGSPLRPSEMVVVQHAGDGTVCSLERIEP